MLTALLISVTPFLVNAVTGLIKMLPSFASLRESRRPIIRLVAALASFGYVGLGLWIEPDLVSGDTLNAVIGTFGLTFITWLSSLGSYHAFFNKKEEN
ncbi:hypothetical protein A2Z56_02635 [Candidatus Kaiserbacteria bacterium RIFCSPHIGHO2_12_45_16]|nr:MAG: hypothetical protein A2Z56_02635 [Candidatus Kaiserbacteria bacterium RIFCSPHIGHO2_12_45_16]